MDSIFPVHNFSFSYSYHNIISSFKHTPICRGKHRKLNSIQHKKICSTREGFDFFHIALRHPKPHHLLYKKKQQQACFFNTKMMCLCLTLLLERDPHKSEKEGWTETAISRRRRVGGRLPAQWGEQGNAEWMGSIFKQSTLLPWAIYMVGLTFTFTIMHTCMVTGAGRMVELTKLEKIIGAKKKTPQLCVSLVGPRAPISIMKKKEDASLPTVRKQNDALKTTVRKDLPRTVFGTPASQAICLKIVRSISGVS